MRVIDPFTPSRQLCYTALPTQGKSMFASTNWHGVWTLYKKEVGRFLKVYNQTLLAPMVNALLFLAIFMLALGRNITDVHGIPLGTFMGAGLIMMSVIQQAFANTSSSLIMGKVLGTIIDYLIPPISPGEMLFSMVMAGVTRGITIGILVAVSVSLFTPLAVHHFGILVFYVVSASLLLSLLGMLAGIVADTFDQMAAITSYIITPLAFLSGTFYSVNNLPAVWFYVTHANPFFYMIDGFRYAMTDHADGSIGLGMAFLTLGNIVCWALAYTLLKRGYKIKT